MTDVTAPTSGFAPLRQKVFAVLWIATIVGNTGSFIRDVASSWLVTDLSAAPAAVAMVQAAATLPIFLLAIPAGVLSDILDRRKFLIVIQLLLAAASICLMLLSATGLQSVSSLIALTFVGGIGAALMAPTWQAIVPELVARQDVKSAVALNSLGINISRSIGPAVGGLFAGLVWRGLHLRRRRHQLCLRDRGSHVVETRRNSRRCPLRALLRSLPRRTPLREGQPRAARCAPARGCLLCIRQCCLGASSTRRA